MASQIPANVDEGGKKLDLMQKVDGVQDEGHEPTGSSQAPAPLVPSGTKGLNVNVKNMERPTFVPCDKLWYAPFGFPSPLPSPLSPSSTPIYTTHPHPFPIPPTNVQNPQNNRDRVQTSAVARSGAIDMDDLCAQLKSKARCSGNGAVIDQADIDKILGPPAGDQDGFLTKGA